MSGRSKDAKKESNFSGKNNFFDIKPLNDWGIIWFPISMSNISTKQKVSEYIKWIEFFGEKKIGEPKIGLNFTYCDFLYLNSEDSSKKLKDLFMFQMISHKNGLKNFIHKKRKTFQIQHAFHFGTWGNLYLEVEGDFNIYFKKIKDFYERDKRFQKYIKEDSVFLDRRLNQNQIDFFLEEHLMTYLILNKKIRFRNEYVQGREKWILLSYPGVPPKAQIYLIQKNPLKFSSDNIFIGQYDLLSKKFYNFRNFDLETWNYE